MYVAYQCSAFHCRHRQALPSLRAAARDAARLLFLLSRPASAAQILAGVIARRG